MERLFEALEESRIARGNKGAGERNRKRDLKVDLCPPAYYMHVMDDCVRARVLTQPGGVCVCVCGRMCLGTRWR